MSSETQSKTQPWRVALEQQDSSETPQDFGNAAATDGNADAGEVGFSTKSTSTSRMGLQEEMLHDTGKGDTNDS